MSNFYELLGISKQASTEEIKKAFRKKSLEHHPDRGGNEQDFKKINEAYQTLIDNNKRRIYDIGGNPDNPIPDINLNNIFNMFGQNFKFNGFPFEQHQAQRRNTTILTVNVDLEDLYFQNIKTFSFPKKIICRNCLPKHKINNCTFCNGTGKKIEQLSLGMISTRKISTCMNCKGTGKSIDLKSCENCLNSISIKEEKINIKITSDVITIDKNGQEELNPDGTIYYNDLITKFTFTSKDNYKKIYNDIIISLSIPLSTFIIGLNDFSFKLFNKKELLLNSKPVESQIIINNKGLPSNGKIIIDLIPIVNIDKINKYKDKIRELID